MKTPDLPQDEAERLATLRSYAVLDTPAEAAFDDLTELASRVCGMPIALVSLVDGERQWFKSKVGLDAEETPRDVSFCGHAILDSDELLVVSDSHADERFSDNPLVTGDPQVRFYAGAPLVSSDGHAVGTLCVIDRQPHEFSAEQRSTLRILARQVVTQLELRRAANELAVSEQGARAAAEAKSAFLANMSHEIRTPMNAVLGMTELLAETPLSGEQAQYVRLSRNAGQSLLDLINGILDLSKAEAGMLQLGVERFELRSYLEGVVEVLAVAASRKGIGLALDIDPDLPGTVEGDPQRLRQVLINLIGNSVKFTEQGHVVLHAAPCPDGGDGVTFSVRDSGIGIAPEDVVRLFQPFTQVESSSDRRFGGTGLGLNLSQRLVRLMGGQIEVSSVVEHGSTFFFTIDLPVPADVQLTGRALSAVEGKRVLLVDDCGPERVAGRKLLESLGFRVTEADSGQEGLALWSHANATKRPFDQVFVDVRMPQMSGLEVARAMAGCGGDLEQVVLLLNQDFRRGDEDLLVELGVGGTLYKPLRHSALCDLARERFGPSAGERSAEASAAAELGVERSTRPARVLLVDDCDDNRFLVLCYLKKTRFEVDVAVDGREAVEMFQAGGFDLVLMDIQLPIMDGYEATRCIRSFERERGLARTPVLALTADAMPEHRAAALEAGADEHLDKPIQKHVLIDALERFLSARSEGDAERPVGEVATPGPALPAADGMEALRERYLGSRRSDLGKLNTALGEADFTVLQRLGHNMKGSGASYGFDEISAIGAALETAALEADLGRTRSAVHRLESLMAQLCDERPTAENPTE